MKNNMDYHFYPSSVIINPGDPSSQGFSTTFLQQLPQTRTLRRVAKQIDAPEHVKLEWLKEAIYQSPGKGRFAMVLACVSFVLGGICV